MTLPSRALVAAALAVAAAVAAQPGAAPTRGQLLYDNHCIECHNTQIHWRELKQARDWKTLKTQVRRWQEIGRLSWTESDVEAVARYLNRIVYRFDVPGERFGQRTD